jgi:hypothetical protein
MLLVIDAAKGSRAARQVDEEYVAGAGNSVSSAVICRGRHLLLASATAHRES